MQEQAKFWYVPVLDNLELFQATCLTRNVPRHTHETYAIGIIERGIAAFEHDKISQRASLGDVIVINPGDVHTCNALNEAGHTHRMLYPSVALVKQAMAAVSDCETIPLFQTSVLKDQQLAQQIYRPHVTLTASACQLEQETTLLWTLTQLIRQYADARIEPNRLSQERQAVKQIKDYLEAHYAENVSLEALSHLTNLSPFHLTRVFCRSVGLPPHNYLNQVRISKAKQLLAQAVTIAQVALETGFSHQSHLNRHFKRLNGMTPKQYQQMSKNVQD